MFHRGQNKHKNGVMFGKLVLGDAARFFDNLGLIERAMCSKIENVGFYASVERF